MSTVHGPFQRLVASTLVAAGISGCSALGSPQIAPIRPVQVGAAEITTADGYYADAAAAILERNYGRALDLLQLARRKNPHDVRVLNAFAVAYDKLGRFDLSARYYSLALEADPASSIVQANIAYSGKLRGYGSGAASVDAPVREVMPALAEESVRSAPAPVVLPTVASIASPTLAGPPVAIWPEPTAPVQKIARAAPVVIEPAPPTSSAEGAGPALAPAPAQVRTASISIAQPTRAERLASPTPTPRPSSSPASVARVHVRPAALVLLDRSGQSQRAKRFGEELRRLGWSAGRVIPLNGFAPVTTIRAPAWRAGAARALARSLPMRARLVFCSGDCSSIQLLLGQDVRRWRAQRLQLARTRKG